MHMLSAKNGETLQVLKLHVEKCGVIVKG
ncbi:Protein of unknown function [Bacillus cytotoxicus]|nr:Protein of unknown function [Bacillus cytotoxicus]